MLDRKERRRERRSGNDRTGRMRRHESQTRPRPSKKYYSVDAMLLISRRGTHAVTFSTKWTVETLNATVDAEMVRRRGDERRSRPSMNGLPVRRSTGPRPWNDLPPTLVGLPIRSFRIAVRPCRRQVPPPCPTTTSLVPCRRGNYFEASLRLPAIAIACIVGCGENGAARTPGQTAEPGATNTRPGLTTTRSWKEIESWLMPTIARLRPPHTSYLLRRAAFRNPVPEAEGRA